MLALLSSCSSSSSSCSVPPFRQKYYYTKVEIVNSNTYLSVNSHRSFFRLQISATITAGTIDTAAGATTTTGNVAVEITGTAAITTTTA